MRAKPDLSRAVFVEVPAHLAKPWRQPEGECTVCGKPHADLQPATVAGYGVVLDEKLCPSCREQLEREDAFVQL